MLEAVSSITKSRRQHVPLAIVNIEGVSTATPLSLRSRNSSKYLRIYSCWVNVLGDITAPFETEFAVGIRRRCYKCNTVHTGARINAWIDESVPGYDNSFVVYIGRSAAILSVGKEARAPPRAVVSQRGREDGVYSFDREGPPLEAAKSHSMSLAESSANLHQVMKHTLRPVCDGKLTWPTNGRERLSELLFCVSRARDMGFIYAQAVF